MKYIELIKGSKWLVLASVVLGFVIGLTWGWVIQPVEWTDAAPNTLAAPYKEDFMRMVIDSLRTNAQTDLAKNRVATLGDDAGAIFSAVKANPGTIDRNFLSFFESAVMTGGVAQDQTTTQPQADAAATPVSETSPTSASTGNSWLGVVGVILGIMIALGAVAASIFFYLKRRQLQQFEDEEEEEYDDGNDQNYEYNARGAAPRAPVRAPAVQQDNWQSNSKIQQPFARFQTTYVLGDDGFNESFSIDSRNGEFLGDCGFGISEFIGIGAPKKATAFEVWMFDKNDIQTVTKVLMSPFAHKDAGYRARLEAKGELIEIQPHKQIKLETATLFMIATVADVQWGQGMTEDPSHVEQLTLDLAIWQK